MRQAVLILALLVATLAQAGPVDDPVSLETATLRLMHSESGWRHWGDMAGVMEVIDARADRFGSDQLYAMKRYSCRTFRPGEVRSIAERYGCRPRGPRQLWINELDVSCEEPAGFREANPTMLWERPTKPWDQRRMCLATVEWVRELLRRPPGWVWGLADHWGSPIHDRHRGIRAGWVLLWATPSQRQIDWVHERVVVPHWVEWTAANDFWCAPELSDCPEHTGAFPW